MASPKALLGVGDLEWEILEALIQDGEYGECKNLLEGCKHTCVKLLVNLLGMKLIRYLRRMIVLMEKSTQDMSDKLDELRKKNVELTDQLIGLEEKVFDLEGLRREMERGDEVDFDELLGGGVETAEEYLEHHSPKST
jgi:hypothetical protein